MDQRLLQELQRVGRRYRRWYLWTALAIGWLVAAMVGAGLLALGWTTGWASSWTASVPALLGLTAACVGIALAVRAARDHDAMARRIEAKHRELQSLLLAATEQRPSLPEGKLGFLQETIIGDALAHNRRNDWREAIPRQRIRTMQLAGIVSLALLVLVTTRLASHAGLRSPGPVPLPTEDAARETIPYSVIVTPGDTEIERGTSLVVTARFDRRVPDDATLVCRDESATTQRMPMSLSLSDPMFGARMADIRSDLSYRVEYAEQTTREYRVVVYEHPRLQRADARLVFPQYTSLPEKRVEDTRRITAVEGTEVTLICHLNKPVESARLVDDSGEQIDLAAGRDTPTVYTVTRIPKESGRYRLHLVDAGGRQNKQPPEIVFQVTPNRPPDVKIARPARDVRVSPIEELLTEASIWDDFSLVSYGVSFSLGGDPPKEVVLGRQTGRNERREIEHTIEFETLEVEADQLLSYFFWAEDVGPDGQPRRTFGDMYFAEVRPFEEIFRQGEQPPDGDAQRQQQQQQQGGGENSQQAQELAEKQKQIINATWKVIRRETSATPSDLFAEDGKELQTAQQEALDQLATLAEKIEDAQSQQHVADVQKHMDDALTHLTESVQSLDPQVLHPALAAEQAAYQALLKLRAREHRVVRGNPQQQQQQSGSASGAQSRAQQQLEQLELKDTDNRYETQSEARSQQDQANRETQHALNRLRDLARRQSDLNERLKELQSALEEAKTDQQREEIQRRLKRLREQQQEMLHDVDELRDRMAQPQNQERMADSRQDLQQTRENIRQTTEALEQGQVSRAVASGTRAERELKQMREEFRRQASDRFSEEMRDLRQEARRLDENEEKLAERLKNLDRAESKTNQLRESDDREQIGEGFQRQGEDLDRLLDEIQETVEAAEETEPLMSGQLYDTLRRTRQRQVGDALDATRTMLERGILDQARSAESQAGQGIEELRQGVEKAAESVLGDEDEALRRAHEALEDLADQLNEEMQRADSQQPSDSRQSGQPDSRQANAQSGQGDRPPEQPPQTQGGRGQPSEDGSPPQPDEQSDRPPTEPTPQPSTENAPPRPGGQPQPGGQPSLRGGQPGEPPDRSEADGQQRAAGGEQEPRGPIAGNDFVRWSDQLRDVEEMMEDPELRAQAASIRDRARAARRQARGGSTGPNWDMVREFIAEPLCELRDRVAEELLRRGATETMVPIDRDPVPPKYTEQVRRYYEQLGSGQ